MDEMIVTGRLPMATATAPDNPLCPVKVGEKRSFIQTVIRTPQSVGGLLLAAAGLLWVLHDFQLAQLWTLLTQLNARWIALAVGCDIMSYVCQGWRWRLLLKPVTAISTLRATQAVYAGLFTNEILPLRLGELVRTYLVSRWTAVRFVAVLPTLLVERLFDALWLVVGIGLTALFMPFAAAVITRSGLAGLERSFVGRHLVLLRAAASTPGALAVGRHLLAETRGRLAGVWPDVSVL